MATCAVPRCGQTALRYQVFHGALCHFCPEHHLIAVRVHRELPMAIQEMLALAMLAQAAVEGIHYSLEHGSCECVFCQQTRTATVRVRSLRALETILQEGC